MDIIPELEEKLKDLGLSAEDKALLTQKLKELKKLLDKIKSKAKLPEIPELLTE